MTIYRRAAMAALAAVLVASCAAESEPRIVLPAAPAAPTHECVIASNVIRIPPDIDVSRFEDAGFTVWNSNASIQEIQGLRVPISDAQAARVLSRNWYVDLSTASPAVDVLDVLAEFRSQGAAPVHALSFEGHWKMFPGGEDDQVQLKLSPLVASIMQDRINAPVTRDAKVAIVDSGFPRLDGWPGLDVGLTSSDRPDRTPSHGAFVTSILKQVAPGLDVGGARAGSAAFAFVDQDGNPFDPDGALVSDELAVEIAIERLRDWSGGEPTVLNISMGTVGCPEDDLLDPPTALEKVLASWNEVTTFAAAGNERPHAGNAFYPAAYSEVAGVGALNVSSSLRGDRLVTSTEDLIWDEGVRLQGPVGPWVDHRAIGADVLGVGRPAISSWSGSSFATPLIVGLYLNATHAAGLDAASFEMVKDLIAFEKAPRDGCQLMGLRTNGSGTPTTSGGVTNLWCSPIPANVGFGTVEASEQAERGG